ncbi:Fatty acid hydroxylase [Corchorus capsularis]|uniref:Fatty acid hydroxylase n=1 Tax=Corchorus capsularis TaxID=210143 RepID=A0A1R3I8Z7_COCAP|nr:Fatty acid hydroxylase [Corchorus capsularis]
MALEISDEILGIFVPIIVYWVYSGMYVILESFKIIEKYKLHSKKEENEKNLVSRFTVVKGVLLQQTFQAIVFFLLFKVMGENDAGESKGESTSSSIFVIATQIIVAMLVLDTYQYFTHRYAHQNKFLYRNFHSYHHRLVVPYSFGALYNHLVDGLFFDTMGGALSAFISGMSPRTSIFFFSFATIKTIDDHCGILFPGNPFHIFFWNNTAFHDVHHQLHGTKYNFSQPFFVMWDQIMGTYMPYSIVKRAEGMYVMLESFEIIEKYKLHSKKEENEKNLVSRFTVVKGVLLQQTFQAIVIFLLFKVMGENYAGESTSSIFVKARQFFVAMLVFDTYQYFTHRYAHHNKFLYRHFHSYHHRLVVPYSFGAFYNHLVDGCLFDTMGGALSAFISGMSPRTSMFFFCFTTIKAIDDHCGILFPGNPFHLLFWNNTAFHDVHHQLHGIYVCLESFENYRLHSKKEEDEKNLVSKRTVVKGVILQQILQAAVAVLLFTITGSDTGASTEQATSLIVLARQFITAMLVMDTWQYFFHRYMHHNKFLYRHLHSQHHRLVVPYAFGALYNHPLEGLLMDTIGGALSFLVSGMSPRTSIFFFSFATIKTVDDHCGLLLPGNLFHIFFRNNAAYHDVHHQLYGSKYNFSQPFFVMWDRILGTYMPYTLEKRVEGGFEARPTKEYKDD